MTDRSTIRFTKTLDDRRFLEWIAERLVHANNDSPNADFVLRLLDLARSQPDPGAPVASTPGKTPAGEHEKRLRRGIFGARNHAELAAALDALVAERDAYRIEADCAMRDYDRLEVDISLAREALTRIEEIADPSSVYRSVSRLAAILRVARAALAGVSPGTDAETEAPPPERTDVRQTKPDTDTTVDWTIPAAAMFALLEALPYPDERPQWGTPDWRNAVLCARQALTKAEPVYDLDELCAQPADEIANLVALPDSWVFDHAELDDRARFRCSGCGSRSNVRRSEHDVPLDASSEPASELRFAPRDDDGRPRVFAGMHRPSWDELLAGFQGSGATVAFGETGGTIYTTAELRAEWLAGGFDEALYEVRS